MSPKKKFVKRRYHSVSGKPIRLRTKFWYLIYFPDLADNDDARSTTKSQLNNSRAINHQRQTDKLDKRIHRYSLDVVVAKKKYKRAVDRNLIRRIAREYFRINNLSQRSGHYHLRLDSCFPNKSWRENRLICRSDLDTLLTQMTVKFNRQDIKDEHS